MTNDYKEKIFNFISGHYNIEQPANNEPYYVLESNLQGALSIKLKQHFVQVFGTSNYTLNIFDSIQAGDKNNDGYEYQVVYGEAHASIQGQTVYSNFILVVSIGGVITALYDKYSSGTDLNEIVDLQRAEDGTFYAIEYTGNGFRYAQYNNFCLPYNDEYVLKLRDTANISSADLTMNSIVCNPVKIKKTYGHATYAITCQGNSGSTYAIGTLFLIVEGGSNTWSKCPYNSNIGNGTIEDTYAISQLDGDDNEYYSVRIMYRNASTGGVGLFEGDSASGSTISFITSNVARGTTGAKAMFVNYTKGYVLSYSLLAGIDDNAVIMYLDSYDGDTYTEYDSYSGPRTNGVPNLKLKENNGDVFMFLELPKNTYYADLWVGRVWDNALYYQQFQGINNIYLINTANAQGFYFVSSNFNLCKIGIYAFTVQSSNPDQFEFLTQIFNENNYNGFLPYQDLTSLNPTQAILENTNGDILFARNLYSNVYSGGNQIISSVQVPNNYLNGVNVDVNKLYGYTNNEIVDKNKTWSKTEYENVFINFMNYYQVVDKTQANPKYMTISSNQVSNYIYNNTTGYGNIDIKKYRLNYADGTSSIHLLTLNYDGVNNVLGISFAFYQAENHKVNSIDILSNDETIAYITIDAVSYEINKVHNISMNMHVE